MFAKRPMQSKADRPHPANMRHRRFVQGTPSRLQFWGQSIKLDPGRCMVAWLLPAADLDVHPSATEPVRN